MARYNASQHPTANKTGQSDSHPTKTQIPTETTGGTQTSVSHPVPTFTEREITSTKTEIHAPEPLTRPSLSAVGTLTVPGVVAVTNGERTTSGLMTLTLNTKLSNAATAKLADMFAKQYFAHEAPDGTTPADWVEGAGYVYRLTGENLALGDFSGDTDLVTAWMNSPGHRANILKPEYTEIGVAVGKGMYNGRETWLAVQVFGKPLPTCEIPSEQTKSDIALKKEVLNTMQEDMSTKKQELDSYEPKSSPTYKEKVDIYNKLVAEYNNLISDIESLVNEFNVEVSSYNACIEG